MPIIDFSHLTPEQRLTLISELWESLEADATPLTEAQAKEIARRVAMLDANPEDGRDAFEHLAELRRRFG